MNRRILIALAVAVLAVVAGPAKATSTYTASSYQRGPTSAYWNPDTADPTGVAGAVASDRSNNQVMVDPSTGDVTILRHNPTPGALDCAGNGPFGYLRVDAVGPASTVKVDFTNLAMDGYTWVNVIVRDVAGTYLGPEGRLRGPAAAPTGSLTVTLDEPAAPGQHFVVDFGLLAASACPNVDGGRATFTGVTVE
jgi:hypothetical protein